MPAFITISSYQGVRVAHTNMCYFRYHYYQFIIVIINHHQVCGLFFNFMLLVSDVIISFLFQTPRNRTTDEPPLNRNTKLVFFL